MSRINDLIKEMCPYGVKKIPLGSLMNRIKEKNYDNSGIDTVYSVTKENGIVKSDDLHDFNVYSDDLSNYSILRKNQYAYNPARLNIGSIARLKTDEVGLVSPMYVIFELDQDKIDFEYFEHLLFSKKVFNDMCSFVEHGARFRFDYKNWNKIFIELPPLKIQKEIVKILNKFIDMQNILEAELEARKSQYMFWRGKVISSSDGRYGKLIELLSGPVTDGPHTTPKLVSEGIPFISASAVHDGKIHLEDAQGFITREFDTECSKKYKPKKWDVYMVKSGSTTGKVAIVDIDDDFNIWSPLAAMRTNNEITSRYLYHLLQTKEIQEQVQNRMSHGSQPNLSMRVLEQFEVKIPTLEEQERIVNVLDKFDVLVNDITVGLPAEIELRRKQYEYYRNKLLSFEELDYGNAS